MKKNDIVKPNFNVEECENYFKDSHQQNAESSSFMYPSWMKQLNRPQSVFDLATPSYREITSIINNIKSSGSPCPFDHISIIVLKRCPIMRTVMLKVISYCWFNKIFPKTWKNAFTILIYKKGNNTDPSNFRPITLQPVLAKIYSSQIRNPIIQFLLKKYYI